MNRSRREKLIGDDVSVEGVVWSNPKGLWSMPVIVSYFTDLFYLWGAYELARSCQAFSLSYHICGVKDLGSWAANTNFKPTWLRAVAGHYRERPLCWIDADGRIRRFPQLFNGLRETTVAYHTWQGRKPASGTVYLGPTPERDAFLAQWEREVANAPLATDQICLGRAEKVLGIEHQELPPEYCHIFDYGSTGADLSATPVVEHMQANRWTRRAVPSITVGRRTHEPPEDISPPAVADADPVVAAGHGIPGTCNSEDAGPGD